MAALSFLNKDRTIAGPGFNRWLVPPAALAIHLCIGMAYGFSVFWLPLSRLIGIKESVVCPADMSFFQQVFTTKCDWPVSMVGWMYTLFFVFLGLSAATFGNWLEHAGPRKAGVVSALCWCGGLVISAIGVILHQVWMLWLGSGVIGGIGLGLGYISPVSTLIKWFPDKRGMATGMAIMGFGGGAMIGAPLANSLMNFYASETSVGVWQTFLTLAVVYFAFMLFGALSYRVPPSGWLPKGWTPPVEKNKNTMITHRHMHVKNAMKTPQFWLLWGVLCLNVSASIGIIGMASPMLQEVFAGRLIGVNLAFENLSTEQLVKIATIGAGFAGLLSVFNIAGRFVWASLSDYIGRKTTFFIFFVLGALLYLAVPFLAKSNSLGLFVAAFCIIVSMYGGGFATIPAYLADMFGTQMVGAIHGRLLTAWSTAGVIGPVLVNYLREYQLNRGVPHHMAYDMTFYILAALLVGGFICNLLVRPVKEKFFMTDEELAHEKKLAHDKALEEVVESGKTVNGVGSASKPVLVFIAWAVVGIPLVYGFWNTVEKAIQLFQ